MRDVKWTGGRKVIESREMVCTPRQARLAMMQTPYHEYPSLMSAVEGAVYTSNDPALVVSWEYATEWRRDDPAIFALANALGLSADEVDNLFLQAMAL